MRILVVWLVLAVAVGGWFFVIKPGIDVWDCLESGGSPVLHSTRVECL